MWPWVAVAVLLVVAGTAGAFLLNNGRDGGNSGPQLAFEVQRGPLVVSISESGTIQAANQEILRSELEGRATILTLVIVFWKRDRIAGALLLPYLVWVTYAVTLSVAFAVMNSG